MELRYELIKKSSDCNARLGKIYTNRGVIETLIFMPVGTRVTVKAMNVDELKDIGSQIILGNTYSFIFKARQEIRMAGGLHKFMNWDKNRF